MGRAARRAQERAERRAKQQAQRSNRSPRASVSVSAPADSTAVQRGSFFRPRWLMDIMSELRKVTWPTRQTTAHLTVVVIVISILCGVLLGAADLGFSWLVERTILR